MDSMNVGTEGMVVHTCSICGIALYTASGIKNHERSAKCMRIRMRATDGQNISQARPNLAISHARKGRGRANSSRASSIRWSSHEAASQKVTWAERASHEQGSAGIPTELMDIDDEAQPQKDTFATEEVMQGMDSNQNAPVWELPSDEELTAIKKYISKGTEDFDYVPSQLNSPELQIPERLALIDHVILKSIVDDELRMPEDIDPWKQLRSIDGTARSHMEPVRTMGYSAPTAVMVQPVEMRWQGGPEREFEQYLSKSVKLEDEEMGCC
jgi:hypothetical protein